LHRQQIIANSKYNIGPAGVGVNCGGGYPAKWCNISQDSVIDSWGMYNRECVSYTAFKVHMDFLTGRDSRDMPYWGGVGNANQWDDNARAAGIPVDNNPTPGSIAISNAGYYGHAMYVEAVSVVNGQQAVYVSQYNAMLDGRYSEGWRYTTGLVFLHF
jgi:surface antigen